MRQKPYLNLLILCAVFSQEIAASSKENIVFAEKSSNLHVRKKRLINKTTNVHALVPIKQVPYIVNIQRRKRFQPKVESICAGSILAPTVILTAAHCFLDPTAEYYIFSGSRMRNYGIRHDINMTIINSHYNPRDFSNDLALLKIYPRIDLNDTFNRKIDLFHGYIFPFTQGTVSGWGCIDLTPRNEMIFPMQLKSVGIPIISRAECHNAYRKTARITDKHVCTLDRTGRIGTCEGDGGNPLVVRGQLLGVMSFRKGVVNTKNPDVFVNLNNPEYKAWVTSNLQTLLT